MQLMGRWVGGCESHFFGQVDLDRIDEDEFFAAAAFVVEPAPFELALVAEMVDFLDAAGDELGGLGHANPRGRAMHAKADLAIDRGGNHLEEPLLLKDGRCGTGGPRVSRWLAGMDHRRNRNQNRGRQRFVKGASGFRRLRRR